MIKAQRRIAMAFVTAEGSAEPSKSDNLFYPTFGSRVPALRSFYLAYDLNNTHPKDHDINLIGMFVGGQSKDLSPNADLAPINLPDGTLAVFLQDAHPNDESFSYNVSHSVLDIPGVRRFQFRDVGAVGENIQTLPIPGLGPGHHNPFPPIIALVGFQVTFNGNRDKPLGRVGIWFRGNELHVVLRDEKATSLDDTFTYLVDFVVIPTVDLNVASGIQTGSARGGEKVSIPIPSGADFLLTGWDFNFNRDNHDNEHPLRELGILRDGNDVTVFYGDEHPSDSDDLFTWRVEWAYAGRTVLAPPTV
jgi:hypothetical protein